MKANILFQLSLAGFFISVFTFPFVSIPLGIITAYSLSRMMNNKEERERQEMIAEIIECFENDLESVTITDGERFLNETTLKAMSYEQIKIIHRNFVQ